MCACFLHKSATVPQERWSVRLAGGLWEDMHCPPSLLDRRAETVSSPRPLLLSPSLPTCTSSPPRSLMQSLSLSLFLSLIPPSPHVGPSLFSKCPVTFSTVQPQPLALVSYRKPHTPSCEWQREWERWGGVGAGVGGCALLSGRPLPHHASGGWTPSQQPFFFSFLK